MLEDEEVRVQHREYHDRIVIDDDVVLRDKLDLGEEQIDLKHITISICWQELQQNISHVRICNQQRDQLGLKCSPKSEHDCKGIDTQDFQLL